MSGEARTIQLFDAHCHLQDERILAEAPALLANAAEAGVCRLSCNGCWEGDWDQVSQLAQAHPNIIPNFGLHPWWIARRGSDWLQQLRQKLVDNPQAGLGECGLDKGLKAPKVDLSLQLQVFEQQLQLAQELGRPISVHCVRAFGNVHEALVKHNIDMPVVLHSWTGSQEMVTTFLQLPKVYFSLSGYLAKVPPQKAISMVKCIPLDRLLLESDSPDGSLVLSDTWLECLPGTRGLVQSLEQYKHKNEPSAIRQTLELVALILDLPAKELAAQSFSNAQDVFCSF